MPSRLGTELPRGKRRGPLALKTLSSAYRNVFMGNGTSSDAEIVLADLANFSGFYRTSGLGFSGEDRANLDGMRVVFGRIIRFIRATETELREIEESARAEARTDAEEGAL